jgi:PAS domain S-box-containing protein
MNVCPAMTDANRAQIRAFLSGLQTLAAFVGPDGRIADHNEAYAEFFGLSDGSDGVERAAAGWLDGATGDGALERAWRGETVRREREMTGARGAARFDVSLIPFMPTSREVVGIILSASRISPTTESAGLHSFAAALDAVADGIVVFDADDRLVYGNSRMRDARKNIAQVFAPGTSFEEFVCAFARSDDALTGDLDLGAWYERRLARHRDPGEPFEFRIGDKWFLCREHRAADGGTLGIYTDITETKRAQEALRDNERLFRDLAEASFDAVFVQEGRTIVDANAKAEALFGWARAELIGLDVDTLIPPRVRAKSIEMSARAGPTTYETYNMRRDGTDIPVEISARKFGVLGGDRRVVAVRDISERKRAEQEMRRQALIWMQISEAVVVLDSDGKILDLNPGAESMFGYPKRELVGCYSSVVHVEESSGTLRRSISEGVARDGRWTGEVLVRRKDGSTLICESDVIQIKDEYGEAVGRIAVCRDTTERVTNEQVLRRSEERFRGLAEASFDAIIVAQGVRIIDVNDKAVALFGFQRDELIGLSLLDLLSPDSRDEVSRVIEQSKTVYRSVVHKRKDGSEFPSEVSARSFVQDGMRIRVVAIRDITVRRRFEEALRESEGLLRVVTDAVPALISYIDADGIYRFANEGYETWFGLPRDEVIGVHFEEVLRRATAKWGDPQFVDERQEFFAAALTGQTVAFERSNVYADGVFRDVQGTVMPLRAEDGEILGCCVFALDVSDATRMGKALKESEQRFRDFAEASGDWFWETDLDQRFTDVVLSSSWSPYGDIASGRVGKTRWDLMADSGRNTDVPDQIQAFMDRGEPFRGFEIRIFLDGRETWFQLSGQPVRDESGALVAYRGTAADITGRRVAELELHEIEDRYRRLIELSPDSIIVQDETGILFANSAASDYYGYDTPDEMVGLPLTDMMPEEDRAAYREWLREKLERREGEAYGMRRRMRRDGTVFFIDIGFSPINWGGKSALMGVARDISEKLAYEEALRESEERYRRLVEISPDAIRIFTDGTVVFANEAAAKLYGAENSSDLVGRSALELVSPDDHESFLRVSKALDEGGVVARTELIGRRVDGDLVDVEAAAARIVWRGKLSHLVVSRDVSARKRADESLRLRERAIAASLNGILFVDAQQPDFPIVYVNPAFEDLTGYDAAEVIGRNCRFLQNEDRDQPDIAKIREAMAESRPVQAVLRNYRKDGSRFWNELRLAPVWDAAGHLTHYIGVQTDVTDRIEGESELRRAVDEAEQANLAKSRFLAAASHDLRQPAQALNVLNQLLVDKAPDESVSRIAGQMGHAIAAMTGVLDSLLDISRLESGVIEPTVSDFRVDELLTRLAGEFGPEAEEKGVDLVVVPSRAYVRADRNLLDRIVHNFVSNALRYTEKGKVLVGCRRLGDGLRIQVWDTGIGIAEDQIEGIFDEFQQLNNPERDRNKGLGLGLAIVNRIARLLEHPIEYRSSLGRGSMFSVTVPLGTLDDRRDIVESTALMALDLSGRSILIVEDNLEVGEATKALVEFWQADVAWAVNADEALTLISGHGFRPDLVIADYRLPDGDTGVEMLQRITELVGPEVPRILMTGDTSPIIVGQARNVGATLLHKPVEPEHLRTTIADAFHPVG